MRCNSETEILIIKNLKIMRKKFEDQVVDFIVSTTAFDTECNNIEVNASSDWVEVCIDDKKFTFMYTGEVEVVLDGYFTVEELDSIKEVMESGEEIWMMYDSCTKSVSAN